MCLEITLLGDGTEVTLSFKDKLGALFSSDGTYGLTIIDNTIGFWDLKPTIGPKPISSVSYIPTVILH